MYKHKEKEADSLNIKLKIAYQPVIPFSITDGYMRIRKF